jgi:hypothetical protein
VAHACHPSYSGGRDQEDRGLKPAQVNNLQDSILKIPNTKRADEVAQGAVPEFKPQYCEKKKETETIGELRIHIRCLMIVEITINPLGGLVV